MVTDIIEALRKQDREVSQMILDNYGAMWAQDKLRTARQSQEAVAQALKSHGVVPETFLAAIRENRGSKGQQLQRKAAKK